jgi:hypothetical protein
MKLDAQEVEGIIVRIWLDMGMGIAPPQGSIQLREIKGIGTAELGYARLKDEEFLRHALLGVDHREVGRFYDEIRHKLEHPAYRNAPAEMVQGVFG